MRLHLAAGFLALTALLSGCGGDREVQGSPIGSASTAAEPVVDPAADAKAVQSVFDKYRTEAAAQNGAAVPALISPDTIAHYDTVVKLARTAGPAEVATVGMMDRLMIARMRVEVPPDFATMDGTDLLVYGVDEGMIDSDALEGNSIGDVRVDGDRAYAPMLVDGEPAGADWEFVRTDAGWTFDLAAGFPLINEALTQVAADGDMTEDEFIFSVVELVTGTPVDASVWEVPTA
ncbi:MULTISPECIES: hypothetical protein [Mycobacteriaceae]|uniref:hypothetical protein n=1 Tax=Mycobacteriaceae TaxID=1762 RepID=UPI0002EE2F11|nr:MULTISPECIES: hypothetical protein [Mycobacteriaceae]MDO3401040.1 hypothetical protein [Mycolicibacterium neoaurum]